ncbi:hypothetical protein [Desulfovibrio gilichinskyi]|nr:hypothetical protein [Desulfovibrio gilichinskyi]
MNIFYFTNSTSNHYTHYMSNDKTISVCDAIEGGFDSEAYRSWSDEQNLYTEDADSLEGMTIETYPQR